MWSRQRPLEDEQEGRQYLKTLVELDLTYVVWKPTSWKGAWPNLWGIGEQRGA